MKTVLGSLAVLAFGVGFVVASGGCEARSCPDEKAVDADAGETEQRNDGECIQFLSVTKWTGTPLTLQANWTSGGKVRVDGRNGRIDVVRGDQAGIVRATFKPFVLRAHDTDEEIIQQNLAQLHTEVTPDGAGVIVKTWRDEGAKSTLGGDILVELPPEFDGRLEVVQDNGTTDVDFAGAASSFALESGNGSCEFVSGSAATSVTADCGNGDMSGTIQGVPAGATGGTFKTGNGDITLAFPGSAKFIIQATAGGVVETGNAETAGCSVTVAREDSKTVVCGGAVAGDPTYTVTASSLGDVVLSF